MKNTGNSDKPLQYDPKSENKIKSLQETITKQNDEIWTLRNKLQTLQHEAQARKNQHQMEIDSYDHKLKKQKSDSDLEFHTAESNHKIQMSDLQRKLEMETQLRNRFENDTKAQADKLCTQTNQIDQLVANIKQLESDKEAQNNKILSLKLHNSRQHDFNNQHDEEKTQMRKTPDVFTYWNLKYQ